MALGTIPQLEGKCGSNSITSRNLNTSLRSVQAVRRKGFSIGVTDAGTLIAILAISH